MVLHGEAIAGIDNKDHGIRLGHSLARLLGHFLVNTADGVGLEAPGVHDDEFTFAVAGVTVVAVTGQTGQVGNDGVAGLGQSVEQGGFADVGTANQRNHGLHKQQPFSRTRRRTARRAGWPAPDFCQ